MSQDHLGLFDTPPSPRQARSSYAIVGLLLAILVVTLSVHDIQLGQINAVIPMTNSTTSLVDLIIATQLYVQASVFRSRGLNALATGYVFSALILIPHALTFPGAFAPNGLLGAGTSTTAWIYMFWRMAVPTAVIFYILFNRADSSVPAGRERPAASVGLAVFTAVALATAATALATVGQNLLPVLYVSRSSSNYTNMVLVNGAVIALAIVAMVMLFRRRKSVLDMWLLVVMFAWLVQTLLFLSFRGRFTVGWYFAVVVVLLSHLFLMLALIAESSRLYTRLALSVRAQKRERDARLMSMDAVAAAIAHEVRQPLAAMALNASAVLRWLDRTPLDPAKIAKPARAIIEDSHRTSEVIESIRSMLAKQSGRRTEFSLNQLVRETASLLGRELAEAKVSLQLALDGALPTVVADRVQLQQVLINLFTNAIQSLAATEGGPRRLAIRSAPVNGHNVLLEFSDTGIGIAPEQMEHIFDAFFTTKESGTGLGLSLCRTIVEEHGGRLWASRGEENGATFSLRLPRGELPA